MRLDNERGRRRKEEKKRLPSAVLSSPSCGAGLFLAPMGSNMLPPLLRRRSFLLRHRHRSPPHLCHSEAKLRTHALWACTQPHSSTGRVHQSRPRRRYLRIGAVNSRNSSLISAHRYSQRDMKEEGIDSCQKSPDVARARPSLLKGQESHF